MGKIQHKRSAKSRKTAKKHFSWKPLAVVLAVILTPFLILATIVLWQGDTKPMVAVADQLQPLDGWVLESENITAPRAICLGDNQCPSMYRRYRVPKVLSEAEFFAFVSKIGFSKMNISGCELYDGNYSGLEKYCETTSLAKNNYIVSVSSLANKKSSYSYVYISVK